MILWKVVKEAKAPNERKVRVWSWVVLAESGDEAIADVQRNAALDGAWSAMPWGLTFGTTCTVVPLGCYLK